MWKSWKPLQGYTKSDFGLEAGSTRDPQPLIVQNARHYSFTREIEFDHDDPEGIYTNQWHLTAYKYVHVRERYPDLVVRAINNIGLTLIRRGDTIQALNLGGEVIVTRAYEPKEQVRVLEFKHECEKVLRGTGKTSINSSVKLARAGKVLRGNAVLKYASGRRVRRPIRLSRAEHRFQMSMNDFFKPVIAGVPLQFTKA